jgi:hypothetical protein
MQPGAFNPLMNNKRDNKLNGNDLSNCSLEQYLISCFPYMKDIQTTNELSIIGNDVN